MLDEGADLEIFDPEVEREQIMLELSNPQLNLPYSSLNQRIRLHSKDIIEACRDSHALVVCTEWDMFKEFDYEKLFEVMKKPASVFDGRLILDHDKLKQIGFHVEAIGKCFDNNNHH